ncbi:MAG: site-specific integrase, partial [Fibromonadales bacterium]|nr:site-specific integrase [Fibromonadales bacterium]
MATIRERSGVYQIRVSAGYDMRGKQIEKSMTWKPATGMTPRQIEKELQRQATLFEDRVKSGLFADGNVRFADFAERWLSLNEKNFAPKTLLRYIDLLNRINPAIGHIRIEKLQAQHLQEFYNNLSESGMNKKTGGGLSAKTILHHHRLIIVILGSAYKQGYVMRDVSELAVPPKVKQKDIVYLDEVQAVTLLNALEAAPLKWKTALTLLLYTGMRRGELIGLEWSDIDFQSGLIYVKRTVQYVSGKKYEWRDENGVFHRGQIITKEPKTESSKRVISVDNALLQLLHEYKIWWLEQKLLNGDRWIATDKIFIRENGGVMHPDSITDFTKKFAKQHNLPDFSPHSLRHTNISLM